MFTIHISVYIGGLLLITSGPISVTVSENENATFQCIYIATNNDLDGMKILWDLNGTTISSGYFNFYYTETHNQYDASTSEFISEIIIPINYDNRNILNYAQFTCIAASRFNFTAPSEPATLYIQGIFTTHKHTLFPNDV